MKSAFKDLNKKLPRVKAFVTWFFWFMFVIGSSWIGKSCGESINNVEPDPTPSRGFYYLENSTNFLLTLRAMTAGVPSFPLPLLQDSVPAMSTANFYILEPGTSSIFLPSHVFGSIVVTAEINGSDSLFYDSVNDGDWELREMRGGPHYFLAIPR